MLKIWQILSVIKLYVILKIIGENIDELLLVSNSLFIIALWSYLQLSIIAHSKGYIFHISDCQILTWALDCRTYTCCWSSWCTPSDFLHNALDVSSELLIISSILFVKYRVFWISIFSTYSSDGDMYWHFL